MSGLAAYVPLEGRTTPTGVVNAMVAAMHRPGPISQLVDVYPDLRVAFDGRLDERSDLVNALGARSEVTDEGLIAAAYRRWGYRFPDRVVGDFAVVVVDRRSGRVFGSRDLLGCRPLAYARNADGVIFASDPRGVAAAPGVDTSLDDLMIASSLLDTWGLSDHTAYRGIKRVLGSHTVEFDLSSGRARGRRWWDPPTDPLELASDEEYEARFRAILEEAVRCRLTNAGPVATDLSGGLDSSSVTATAAKLAPDGPIAFASSFAAPRFDGGRFDEGERRKLLTRGSNITLLELDAGDVLDRAHVDRLLEARGLPEAGAFLLLSAQRYEAAVQRGATVLLDGYDGDASVNLGFQRLIALLVRLRWLALHRELRALASQSHAPYRSAVYEGIYLSCKDWLAWSLGRRPTFPPVVKEEFIVGSGMRSLVDGERHPLPGSPAREMLSQLTKHWLAWGMEARDAVGQAVGLQVEHPYADRRLVEFCLRLPPDQHLRNGWTRWIVRSAMKGIMPDEARWYPRKGSLSTTFIKGYATAFPVEDVLRTGGGLASAYLDPAAFRGLRERYRTGPSTADAFALLSIAQVDRWLQMRG